MSRGIPSSIICATKPFTRIISDGVSLISSTNASKDAPPSISPWAHRGGVSKWNVRAHHAQARTGSDASPTLAESASGCFSAKRPQAVTLSAPFLLSGLELLLALLLLQWRHTSGASCVRAKQIGWQALFGTFHGPRPIQLVRELLGRLVQRRILQASRLLLRCGGAGLLSCLPTRLHLLAFPPTPCFRWLVVQAPPSPGQRQTKEVRSQGYGRRAHDRVGGLAGGEG
jgi:hypothetical protein